MEGSDMFVVECTSTPGNEIELTIDSDTSVGIDACAELSRAVEAQFDRDEEDFSLTVMSAGIGSELKSLRQYRKLAGKSAVPENRSLLRQIANAVASPLIDREFRNLHVIQEDLTLVRSDQTYCHIKGGRLSRSVRTKQTNDLPLFHVNRYMIHDRTSPIFLYQVLRTEHHSLFV